MATENVNGTEQALNMLAEIVVAAHEADRLCYHHDLGDDAEADALLAERLRQTICRIGWLAESSVVRFGAGGHISRGAKAENWLMPPACRSQEAQP